MKNSPIKTVLITGGAGFIGSHLADELLERGYRVRALDCLIEQVHGSHCHRPEYLHPDVDLRIGDVRNPDDVTEALVDVDAVFHFAAMVGVGQSMYQIADYTSVNNLGTAVLLEALAKRPVQRLVVASSMSIYGEGLYRDSIGATHTVAQRAADQFAAGEWELRSRTGERLIPVATPETKTPDPSSVYALSKYDQEVLCLTVGGAYKIPTTALRFFNVYGPRQSLSNPYTGVMAIFASRFLNHKSPRVFEDGQQRRDFVSVYDVVQACRLAMESPHASGEVFNVASGNHYSIVELAERMARVLGMSHIEPEILNTCRVGDIRHCFADISKARRLLGYQPNVTLERGFEELAAWLEKQVAVDRVEQAGEELARRGLTIQNSSAAVKSSSRKAA